MSSCYLQFGLLATQLASAAIVLGPTSIPILSLWACTSAFKSNPHWLPPLYQKAATCAILGIVQVAILVSLFLSRRFINAPPAPQVHWSTYVWGTTTILFGLDTMWNQRATYLLNKEKWTAERANLEAEKVILKAKKAELEALMAITNGDVKGIQATVQQIQSNIKDSQNVVMEHE